MEAMASSLRPGVQYVVVQTKADKKDGKVSPTVTQVGLVAYRGHMCILLCICIDLDSWVC